MLAARRSSLALVPVLLLGASLLGCGAGQREPDTTPVETVVEGGVFEVAQTAPSSLDPALVYDSYDAALVNQIYDGLLRHDNNFTVRPDIARSWTISRDGLAYRFDLEREVRFHDGSLLTADDVAFSIERVFRLPEEGTTLAREYLGVIQGAKEFARGDTEKMSGIRVLTPHEIEIVLERPYAAFLNVLASEMARVVPREYVKAHGDDVLQRKPIGSGAFRLSEWIEGDRLVLERFDDYHGRPARLQRLIVHTPGDPVLPHALEGFLAKRLHAIELTMGGPEALAAVRSAQIHRRRELSLTFLGFNLLRPPYDQPLMRRAIAHAIDVESLTGIDAPSRSPANGVLPPGFPGFTPELKRVVFDPETARELLVAAGHANGNGLEPLVIAVPQRSHSVQELIDDLCRQLEAVGIPAQVRSLAWKSFDEQLREGVFDAFLLTWVADLPDPDSFFYPLLHSRGSVNHFHYQNPEVDEALDTARRETDHDHRIDLYRAIERTVIEEAALVPIHFSSSLFAVQPQVREFELSSMGGADLPFHQVWLAPPALASAGAITNGEAR